MTKRLRKSGPQGFHQPFLALCRKRFRLSDAAVADVAVGFVPTRLQKSKLGFLTGAQIGAFRILAKLEVQILHNADRNAPLLARQLDLDARDFHFRHQSCIELLLVLATSQCLYMGRRPSPPQTKQRIGKINLH
ncbi:hypothetical protein ATN84_21590 [Paramesorhizobium deserti]|uniref:Uncharacterized protein n=1 Tax=Paramesorhizobium deserti TaxID=1494590 RepID=A0A135HNN3_9HYPH|nr:hypothetical protein [Paramesorhizobium deserti]KXF74827.1 hypothetical protein ATN84_21590 [Paramesorhizobium deserti]